MVVECVRYASSLVLHRRWCVSVFVSESLVESVQSNSVKCAMIRRERAYPLASGVGIRFKTSGAKVTSFDKSAFGAPDKRS